MEQESEGQAAKMRILEFERKVRMEALSGCQQIKNVENHIRDAPEGGLLGVANGEDARALRTAILNASAKIVEKFSKVIRLLSTAPNAERSPRSMTTGGSRAQEQLAARAGALSLDTDSPLLSPEDSHTPGRMQVYSPSASPCHTPHSGSGMSEGSPGRPNHVALDSDDDIGGNSARRRPHDASAATGPELSEKPALPKKRKYLPKYQTKQRAIGTGDPANDGPPDDGYTWRKYGQKDIKESAYPRSYYRCTHKTDLGCPSIKMVQRSDDDPNYYDVTYRGHHICPSVEQRTWHFGLAPSHIAIHELLASDPKGPSSSALLMGARPVQLRPPGQSQENVIVGTGHGPAPFPALKSTSGLTVPPSNSSNKSSTAISTTTTTTAATTGSAEMNQIVATGFTPGPLSATQQRGQNIPTKLAGNPLDQDGFNQSRLARDSLFGPGSNLMSLLLGRGDGGPIDLEFEDLSVQQQQRESTADECSTERMPEAVRSHSLNNIPMANAAAGSQASAQQYMERWAESGMLMSFKTEHATARADLISRNTPPPPARSEVVTSHAQQTRPLAAAVSYSNSTLGHLGVAGVEMYNIHTTESEVSEVISPPPIPMGGGDITSETMFTMGMPSYMLDSPGSHQQMYMDYEFRDAMYYETSQTD